MNQKRIILMSLVLVLLVTACAKVPFTGRKQARLIPSSQINSMSFQQYDAFLKENNVVTSGTEVNMVRRVGYRIQRAAEAYYKANGMAEQLAEFKWEFNLVRDNNVNAFCMPGGKVVIFTGILPICQGEDGLAVVMGHEIAHALAHHGNERMTQQLGVSAALVGIDAFMGYKASQANDSAAYIRAQQTRQVLMAAAGAGAQVGILLPFSRTHESEADRIGLILMAIAGYNVDEAAPFWERMGAKGGQAPPEFLSTHPSPGTRSANLRKWAPEAKQIAAQYPLK